MGKAYIRTVIDDYSRLVYADIHHDETTLAATGSWCARSRGSETAV